MMNTSVASIAEELRAAAAESPEAFGKIAADRYAPSVELVHVPPMDGDGPWSREQLVSHAQAEAAALRRAMPDYRLDDVEITVDGDVVDVTVVHAGTLADGRLVASPIGLAMTVADGSIVRLAATIDLEKIAPFAEAMQIGGYDVTGAQATSAS
jgi:hypothetical protein